MLPQSTIPFGYCQCGCGQQTTRMKYADPKRGLAKGQPISFIIGHNMRGKQGAACHRWHGGRTVSKVGYVALYRPDHPYASTIGYVMEHRLVMEQHLGRYLTAQEIVHHRDGNRGHNAIENLQLTDRSEHRQIHACGRWSLLYDACVDCGTTEIKHNAFGRCKACDKTWRSALPQGARCSNVKLNAEKVIEIRRRYTPGRGNMSALAREFGVSVANVNAIIHRKRWKHV